MLTGSSLKTKGRQFLTPGFFSALERAHQLYGILNWTTLFEPAIYFAQEGFVINELFAGILLESKGANTTTHYNSQQHQPTSTHI